MYNYFQNPYLYGSQQPQYTQPQQSIIFGKMVDGVDVVKGCDVPIGMTYFFPKADGMTVYSKGWLDNGTTTIKEYKIVEEQQEIKPEDTLDEKITAIMSAINSLNEKIDKVPSTSSSPVPMKKKG